MCWSHTHDAKVGQDAPSFYFMLFSVVRFNPNNTIGDHSLVRRYPDVVGQVYGSSQEFEIRVDIFFDEGKDQEK